MQKSPGSEARLLYFPDVAGTKEFVEIAGTFFGDDVAHLLVNHVFIAGQVIPSAENADGGGETGAVLHVRKQEGVGRAGVMGVVDD